jgi:hypothetical protein
MGTTGDHREGVLVSWCGRVGGEDWGPPKVAFVVEQWKVHQVRLAQASAHCIAPPKVPLIYRSHVRCMHRMQDLSIVTRRVCHLRRQVNSMNSLSLLLVPSARASSPDVRAGAQEHQSSSSIPPSARCWNWPDTPTQLAEYFLTVRARSSKQLY